MPEWTNDAIFYHIYPLGLCGAPARNDFYSPQAACLEQLYPWLDHMQELGINALYLGPVFESSAHGYDTADYYRVDRRLGSNQTLKELSREMHQKGLRLVLDGVFNHVGRDFWAFKDVQAKGQASEYCGWFSNLDFGRRSPNGDSFSYEGWAGHYDLVKLNLHNPAVVDHLLGAVAFWMDEFQIDGLRLDAADVLDHDFIRKLAAFCRESNKDFWLMGEVVQGDYQRWANPEMLDSVTNYECYKGLWSSHANKNYFEIAYSLNRLFGKEGVYRHLRLFNFADNHDVNRVASNLNNPAELYPLYCLLFTMPGIPSIYYGSEWGIEGKRTNRSDTMLRPALDLAKAPSGSLQPALAPAISRFARLRQESEALKWGDYRQLLVGSQQFAFSRRTANESFIVAVNSADKPAVLELDLRLAGIEGREVVDLLNDQEVFPIKAGKVCLDPVWPGWARVLRVR
jgi:cyclomaltodextrinase